MREVVCAGCKASAEHGHGKDPEPGSKTFVVFEAPPEQAED